MIAEENVDVEINQTEEGAVAKEGADASKPREASTVLGKFKDVDALAKAYQALQAEFTRRSQRLRVLEKAEENFKEERVEPSGAEKLRKAAEARRAAAREFDEFVAAVETPSSDQPPALERTENTEPEEEALLRTANAQAAATELQDAEKGGASLSFDVEREGGGLSSEQLFAMASKDDAVRLKIVGEYLASLGKSGAPLTSAGMGVFAAPPTRAKTVGQAGDMALAYFRKPKQP